MKLLRFSPWIVILVVAMGTSILWVLSTNFVGSGAQLNKHLEVVTKEPLKGPGYPPIFAYWISGTGGENNKILRLLKAVYHPRNRYLLHLDADSMDSERNELGLAVQSERLFQAFGNVDVVSKTYAVDRTGSSLVSATLHGAAILLKTRSDWDWFITLSSSDYPIVTQDDLLQAFTGFPRDLNFIDHTSNLGWKEYPRFNKIVVDPSLYMRKNTKFFFSEDTRDTPDAFTLFTGSPWIILSRPFTEYCVLSWDNLPRKLLMYFSNVPYAMESYFQTTICNSPGFKNTTVNNDLRYFQWDNPPRLNPISLNDVHFDAITSSGAAFARRFVEDDPILHRIDEIILKRTQGGVGTGSWCSSGGIRKQGQNNVSAAAADSCFTWGNIDVVETTPSGNNLRKLVSEIVLKDERLRYNQCKCKFT